MQASALYQDRWRLGFEMRLPTRLEYLTQGEHVTFPITGFGAIVRIQVQAWANCNES